MSDRVRDRIAAVLQAQPPVRLQSQSDWLDWTENRADAVIAELGLHREWGLLDHTDSGLICDTLEEAKSRKPLPGESLHTRLVTDWHDVS